jgi:hypothetical protein
MVLGHSNSTTTDAIQYVYYIVLTDPTINPVEEFPEA